ncbi:MAG TPA: hypothetical protein ENK43_03685 [Planctomycetes bacterium]|nr:hypothetical protein [Planctomycetota bacterium]
MSPKWMALTLGLGVFALLSVGMIEKNPASEARGATSATPWSFEIRGVEASPRGEGPPLLAFLLGVDEEGRPSLQRIFSARGVAPAFEEQPDYGRIYRWEILSASGRVLAEGRHFDLLARYTPALEGGCEKSLLGPHSLLLRTPWPQGADRIVLAIDDVRTDRKEAR